VATAEFESYVKLNKKVPLEVVGVVQQIEDYAKLADTIASHLALKTSTFNHGVQGSNPCGLTSTIKDFCDLKQQAAPKELSLEAFWKQRNGLAQSRYLAGAGSAFSNTGRRFRPPWSIIHPAHDDGVPPHFVGDARFARAAPARQTGRSPAGVSQSQESSSGASIESISRPSGEFRSTLFKSFTRAEYSGPSFFSSSVTCLDNASALLSSIF
jgi:hypothetical protein